jgi:Arc/MetJ-type ribon-helix-helix transcriptional regulator
MRALIGATDFLKKPFVRECPWRVEQDWYNPAEVMTPMQITLSKPELQRFIQEQVSQGHFESAEAVIEAGLERLMAEPVDDDVGVNEELLRRLARSNELFARGEDLDFREALRRLKAELEQGRNGK